MQLPLKAKTFSDCFVPFLVYASNFKHFEKKTMVLATLFRKLQTVKGLVRPLYQNTVSDYPLTVNMLNDPKII